MPPVAVGFTYREVGCLSGTANMSSSSTSYYKLCHKQSNNKQNLTNMEENLVKFEKLLSERHDDTTSDSHSDSQSKGVSSTVGDSSNGKPSHSYVALIASAILESAHQKLSLGSIYRWIEERYPYFLKPEAGLGWRNSIRHNLSLNDCFIKVGRCEDGKGNYWSIHPQNLTDFKKGDFRQKQKRRRGKKTKRYEPYFIQQPLDQVYPDYTSHYTEEERRAYRLDEALVRHRNRAAVVPYTNMSGVINHAKVASHPVMPVSHPATGWSTAPLYNHGQSYYCNQPVCYYPEHVCTCSYYNQGSCYPGHCNIGHSVELA